MLRDRALDALKAAAVAQAESAQLRAQLMLRQPAQADVRPCFTPLPLMAVDSQPHKGAAAGIGGQPTPYVCSRRPGMCCAGCWAWWQHPHQAC